MNEIIQVKVQNPDQNFAQNAPLNISPAAPVVQLPSITTESVPKTLSEQREELRERLHANRIVLQQKLFNSHPDGFSPRSATLRFLSNPSTRHIFQRVAGAALSVQAFKSIRYGYSLVQFFRSAYSAFKATRNVVKAKEGKPLSGT
ncbi:MAG: hypothetical protein EOO53_01400 [Gammaproteobacteria bacterium]|nr:MAG: hypothetical protein EOO53_01400 [Gammaproteobacteria bacterium]